MRTQVCSKCGCAITNIEPAETMFPRGEVVCDECYEDDLIVKHTKESKNEY